MAGLLATRVLSDRFETVTLVEKDPLPDEAIPRPGVPQDHHIHVMQKAGQATLEDLFLGYSEEVTDAGGVVLDFATDFEIYQKGACSRTARPASPTTRVTLAVPMEQRC